MSAHGSPSSRPRGRRCRPARTRARDRDVESLADRDQTVCSEGDEPSVGQIAGAGAGSEAAEPDVRRDLVPGARRDCERPCDAVLDGREGCERGAESQLDAAFAELAAQLIVFPGFRRPLCVRAGRGRKAESTTGTDRGQERCVDRLEERSADRSARRLAADLAFQDACSLSSSSSPPGPDSGSVVPRASVMRCLAASACPSMQWA